MKPHESFVELYAGLDIHTADTYSLVLTATRIEHRSLHYPEGWCIFVRSHQISDAQEQINTYLSENYNPPIVPSIADTDLGHNYSMIWVSMVLIAIHWAVGTGAERRVFIEKLGALSDGIINNELFRCVTALTLHKDVGHLAANLAGLMLLGTILCRTTGTGVGWLLMLWGGSGGNYLNALIHRSSHLSIGASTAVFSTLGSLSAFSLVRQIRLSGQIKRSSRIFKAMLPLGSGLALLAFLGANPDTDVLAHLFGFSVGLVLGLFWTWMLPLKLSHKTQWFLAGLNVGILVSAWTIGLSR